MPARTQKQIATFISRVLDPFVTLSVIGILGVIRSGLTGSGKVLFLEVLVLGMIAPPFILLTWAVSKKKISDWDVSKRKQRPLALGSLMFLIIIDSFIVRRFGDVFLFHLFIFFFVWLAIYFVISLFWKISGHSGSAALAVTLIILWYGIAWWPLILLVPLVSWARIVRHNHTPLQTVAGAVVSSALAVFFSVLSLL